MTDLFELDNLFSISVKNKLSKIKTNKLYFDKIEELIRPCLGKTPPYGLTRFYDTLLYIDVQPTSFIRNAEMIIYVWILDNEITISFNNYLSSYGNLLFLGFLEFKSISSSEAFQNLQNEINQTKNINLQIEYLLNRLKDIFKP